MNTENRSYQRGSHLDLEIRVSIDGIEYIDAKAKDISSGGINLISDIKYTAGDKLFLIIILNGFMTEFKFDAIGVIKHISPYRKGFSYGVQFIGLDEQLKIRLDQNVIKDRIVESEPYIND